MGADMKSQTRANLSDPLNQVFKKMSKIENVNKTYQFRISIDRFFKETCYSFRQASTNLSNIAADT